MVWNSICNRFIIRFILFKKIINHKNTLQKENFDDLILWIALGTIIGGRLGYVVFYDLNFYLNNLSLIILDIRKGGMSFHGGLLGVILSTYIFCKRKKFKFFKIYGRSSMCSSNWNFFW